MYAFTKLYRHCYILAIALIYCHIATAQVYVAADATGASDGTSWADAFTKLQDAIDALSAAPPPPSFEAPVDGKNTEKAAPFGTSPCETEIWVKKGTYYPTDGLDSTISFVLTTDLQIYGGFAGWETSLSERGTVDPLETVLSGDIGVVGDSTDNSFHVMILRELTSATVIDGLTITGGNARSNLTVDGIAGNRGGGMYIQSASSPTLRHLILTNNSALTDGGAMSINGSPIISYVQFLDNSAGDNGGAVFVNSHRSPIFRDVEFYNNYAGSSGGAMEIDWYASPVIETATFSRNSANLNGGAISAARLRETIWKDIDLYLNKAIRGGAIFTDNASDLTITNANFNANRATATSSAGRGGGAMYNQYSNVTLKESIFFGNNAGYAGGALHDYYSNTQLSNSSFVENYATNGGAIFIYHSSLAVEKGKFEVNEASSLGGAMFLGVGSSTTMTGSTFKDNLAKSGGAMYINSLAITQLGNIVFYRNSAQSSGGAVHNQGGSPQLSDIQFLDNQCGNSGGGMYSSGGSPVLTNVLFNNNSAASGGGMFSNNSNQLQTNVAYVGNKAGDNGGAIFCSRSTDTLTNVTLIGNTATTNGNQIYTTQPSGSSTQIHMINGIIWGDNNNDHVVNIGLGTSTFTASHSIWPSLETGIDDLTGFETTNSHSDPMLAPDGSLTIHSAAAVGQGDNAANTTSYDVEGNIRRSGDIIDIGAYELVCYNTTIPFDVTTVAGSDQMLCEGDSLILFGNYSGNLDERNHLFRWVDSAGTVVSLHQRDTVYMPMAGTYYFEVHDGPSGCKSVDSIMVQISAGPFAGFGRSISINSGDTLDLTSLLIGDDVGGTWTDVHSIGVSLSDPTSVDFTGVGAGMYDFSYTVSGGVSCPDDVATITVTVKSYQDIAIDTTICLGDSYTTPGADLHAHRPTQDTTVYDYLYDAEGCATTVYTIDIAVIQAPEVISIDTTLCYGDSLIVNGVVYREAGMYRDTVRSTGCDLIYYDIDMRVLPEPIHVDIDTFLCNSASGYAIIINDKPYTATGSYRDTAYYHGTVCDSIIYTIDVFAPLPPRESIISETLCYGDSLIVNGVAYRQTGMYRDTVYYTGTSCDSIIYSIDLTIHPEPIDSLSTVTSCESPYLWRGMSLDVSGTYKDTVSYAGSGCDSMRFELILTLDTLVEETMVYDTTSSLPYVFPPTGNAHHSAGTLRDTSRYGGAGCDSVLYTIHLTVTDDGDDDSDGNKNITDPHPDEPIAINDTMGAYFDSITTYDILANDDFLSNNDMENQGMTTLTRVGGTAQGTVSFDAATGMISYQATHDESAIGATVTVEYEVCNTQPSPDVCSTATVHISIGKCPDLVLTMSPLLPNTAIDTTSLYIRINVQELNNIDVLLDKYVKIRKLDRFTRLYGFSTDDNWTEEGSISGFYIFKKQDVQSGATTTRFSFYIKFDPKDTDGIDTISTALLFGSGGDCVVNNNLDYEKLIYLKK